ncbi:MAG: hypothetical protein AAB296_01345 [Candidatus Desantisbacteria bacterium]
MALLLSLQASLEDRYGQFMQKKNLDKWTKNLEELPDNFLYAVKFVEKKEKLDELTTLRKFLRFGTEKYGGR